MTIKQFYINYNKTAEQQAKARRVVKPKIKLDKKSVDGQLQYYYTRNQEAALLHYLGLKIEGGFLWQKKKKVE